MYTCSSIVLSYLHSYFSVRTKRYTHLLIVVLVTSHKSVKQSESRSRDFYFIRTFDIQASKLKSLSEVRDYYYCESESYKLFFRRLNNNVATFPRFDYYYCIGTK